MSVDGVRTDYGLTPRASDGSCGCSIPLPFSSGRHTTIVIAYSSSGETSSSPLVNGPTANAAGPYAAQVGAPLTVSGAASTDVGGTITNYAWSWGDGTTVTQSASPSATHTYSSAGTFTVTLTVTDSFAVTSSAAATATITVAAPSTPTSPTPASGATGVSTTPTLTWTATGATSYDVQFGTVNPPPTVVSGQTTASYTPATLTASTTYFWRIVARNGAGSTTGAVWSFTTAAGTSTATNIVIYADDIPVSQVHGRWSKVPDATAAAGMKLATSDAQFGVTDQPLAAPADYVDVAFNAAAGTRYAIWLRLAATGNDKYNDSLWVQFSDAVAGGSPVYPLNSTSGLAVNLATDSSASSLSGWGWQNGAYWLTQSTVVTFASSGAHTLRIQVREDGVQFDQIVLSPTTYLTTPPGLRTADTTIVPQGGGPGTPAPIDPPNGATGVSTTPTLTWSAASATSYDVQFGTANPPPAVASGQTSASFTTPALTAGTTYYWQIVAHNSAGSATGPIWSFTTAGSGPGTSDIVVYASDVPAAQIHGSWTMSSDVTAAAGVKLATPPAGGANTSAPLAAPVDYVDVVFDADAGTAYTLWLRLAAFANDKFNDSLWVQFSDAIAGGSPVYPLNSTTGLIVNLATTSTATSLTGWGWQNGAYWLTQPTTVTFATSGSHTLRIQMREDGVAFDQVVLSPRKYLTAPPGPVGGDSTIVPK